jgi:hypothetical protein
MASEREYNGMSTNTSEGTFTKRPNYMTAAASGPSAAGAAAGCPPAGRMAYFL